jgi:hypothetical protein
VALTRAQVDAFNSRQLTAPKAHKLMPLEKGGHGCRHCVLSADHPVHTTPAAPNVVVLGGRRRRS